jgi:DNA-binding NtrC family response regulator
VEVPHVAWPCPRGGLTGNIEQEMASQARDHGAFEVIGKPFSLTVLKTLLARAMKLVPPQ